MVGALSDQNYKQSLDCYRLWFDITQTHYQVPSDQILDTIWKNRGTGSIGSDYGPLIHSTAHMILRFAGDAELDHTLAPHSSGLQSRLCTRSLQEFFSKNMAITRHGGRVDPTITEFYTSANFVAHLANLGHLGESTIHNHILQSLVSHPRLFDHQADALIILFKLAGATFGAYADSSVVDRCFELLKDHSYYPPNKNPYNSNNQRDYEREFRRVREELVQVCRPRSAKAVIELRQVPRKSSRYGRVVGRASLPHPYSPLGD